MKNGFKSSLKRWLLPAAALLILFCTPVLLTGGCSAGSTLRIDFVSKNDAGEGLSLRGKRVMLVKAQVAQDLRSSLPWWDEGCFTRIADRLKKDNAEEHPGSSLSRSDPSGRQRYIELLSRFSNKPDDLLVLSCAGDSAMESRLSLTEWCSYLMACNRDESQILKKQSEESSNLEKLLAGRAEMLRLLSKRQESLAALSEELDDKAAAEESRKAADECRKSALAAEVKAEKFHRKAVEEKEASISRKNMCRHFEKVRNTVNAGASIDRFLKTAGLDEITTLLLKKLEASGSIKNTADIASWFESTLNLIQVPFRANCAAEATFDDNNGCTFRGVHHGDYYLIIPFLRLGKKDLFMCQRLSWKGGARHTVTGDDSLYSMNDWGLMRRIFTSYTQDIIKKAAMDSVSPDDLRALLESSPGAVEERDAGGMTALHYAAQNGNFLAVNLLVSNGADVNALNMSRATPLHCTVIRSSEHGADNNYLEIVNTLLDRKAKINAGDDRSFTALHYAVASRCNAEMIKLLIDRGADVNAPDEEGNTPLHLAARNGYPDVVAMLTARGADILFQNKEGETPLDTAELFSHHLAANVMKEKTMNRKLNLKARELFAAIANNDPAKVRELVTVHKELITVKESSGEGRTLLHFAVAQGNLEIVQYLLSQGAKINVKDLKGRTPLSYAVQGKKSDIAGFLRKHGAR
ncbi:MAG: ankyrin repeat domain-containing protein [Vulcanimicrobiota bacterium]